MLFAILTILGGLFAASSFLVARRPDARGVLDRVAPFQGAVGLGLLVYSAIFLLSSGRATLSLFEAAPLWATVTLIAVGLDVAIGILLSATLLQRVLPGQREAADSAGPQAFRRLVRVQVPIGLAAMSLGLAVLMRGML